MLSPGKPQIAPWNSTRDDMQQIGVGHCGRLCLGHQTERVESFAANASIYGLQAYVFSRQPERARSLAARLQAGSVLINRIAPELLAPFGGVKQSGVGREFGVLRLEAFLEVKSIVSN